MRHQILTALFLAAGAAQAAPSGFGLDVLVNGNPRPELPARGTVYVEAVKGRDYSLRLTNPTGSRVAVALSVDGLNSIDAKHTSSRDARKWVLAPYETVVIPGWQVNRGESRKFVFTGERGSYGAALGKTDDLGVIEAVFFRERLPYRSGRWNELQEDRSPSKDGENRLQAPASGAAGLSQAPSAPREKSASREQAKLDDESAATGMGRRTRFEIDRVDIDLENDPAAVIRLRYEFRPQLIALGVLPTDPDPARIARRERARGFDDFCPEAR